MSGNHQVPRAPSRAQGVTSRAVAGFATSAGVTPPSSLIRAHAPVRLPPTAYGHCLGQQVCAGCCQPRLPIAPSRRSLCESFPTCLDPYPGCPGGALARFFPPDYGLPHIGTRSAPRNTHIATSLWTRFRGCSHSLMFKPAGLLATQIAPTAAPLGAGQLWLLRSRLSQFVTSPSREYASRPFRATNGRGTSTLQDSQPGRLLPQRCA
jgi:hypothetical protein